MRAALALLLAISVPAQAAHCRLSPDECQAVDRELAAERDASIAANRRTQGLEPRAAIPLLADLKVKRMVARAQLLPKPVAREFLRIASCDLDAEVARNGGVPSVGDCE